MLRLRPPLLFFIRLFLFIPSSLVSVFARVPLPTGLLTVPFADSRSHELLSPSLGCTTAIFALDNAIGQELATFKAANDRCAGVCEPDGIRCEACGQDCSAGLDAFIASCEAASSRTFRQHIEVRCAVNGAVRSTSVYICLPGVCAAADQAAILADWNATQCGEALATPGVGSCVTSMAAVSGAAPASAAAVTAAVVGTLFAVAGAAGLGLAVWRWARAREIAAHGESVPMLLGAASPVSGGGGSSRENPGVAALLKSLQSAAAAASPPAASLATSYARRAAYFGARTPSPPQTSGSDATAAAASPASEDASSEASIAGAGDALAGDGRAVIVKTPKVALLHATHGGLRPAYTKAALARQASTGSHASVQSGEEPAPASYYPPAL